MATIIVEIMMARKRERAREREREELKATQRKSETEGGRKELQ